jgi:diguanylate cyclase (GGDEF)-like protein
VNPLPSALARFSRPLVAAVTLVTIAAIGIIDFSTGVEYRIFPLYFLPLSLAAWHLGQTAALAGAVLASLSWLVSNYLAGLRFPGTDVWVINFLMQGVSFALVGSLIARLRQALDQARLLSRTDTLTSLLNDRAFYEDARRILAHARRYKRPVALAYLDVDSFKAVNDRLGHSAGDEVLRCIAGVLMKCVRESDLSARLGGDEFAVLLSETSPQGALVFFERLRALVAETLAATDVPVTVSIGAVAFLKLPSDIGEIVRHADEMMYAAKSSGKNRVRFETVDELPVGQRPTISSVARP